MCMYYKLGQACVTNWGSFVILQIRTNVVTNWGSFIITNRGKCCYNWGSYYKSGQPLLQNRVAITNWGRYYKLWQLLQIGAQQMLHVPVLLYVASRLHGGQVKALQQIKECHFL